MADRAGPSNESLPLLARAMNDVRIQKFGAVDKDKEKECLIPRPRREVHPAVKLSPEQALASLLRAIVGPGSLSVPIAFMQCGIWTGLVIMGVIVYINLICSRQLVHSAQYFQRITQLDKIDYGNLMRYAVDNGPSGLRRFAYVAKFLVNCQIFATNLGIMCVYWIFVSDNIHEVLLESFNFSLHIRLIMAAMIVPVFFICSFRELRQISGFIHFANALFFISLILTLIHLFIDFPPSNRLPGFSNWSQLPLGFGTMIYAYEGIAIVLPLENRMEYPDDYIRQNGVLNTGNILAGLLYAALGFFGYLKYGENLQDTITLNFPNTWYFQVIRLMFVIGVFGSFAVQFFVPMERVEKWVDTSICGPGRACTKCILRYTILLTTFALAQSIPHLVLFTDLVGCVSITCIIMIFPPIIETLTFWSEHDGRLCILLCIKNLLILGFGLIGFVSGSVTALMAIVDTFRAK